VSKVPNHITLETTMSRITLTITVNDRLARCLGSNSGANFLAEQPDRFSVLDVDGLDELDHDDISPLLADDFTGGTMTWLGSVTEALVLRAFEQQNGYRTAVLCDEGLAAVPLAGPGGGYHDMYVVLSARSFGWS